MEYIRTDSDLHNYYILTNTHSLQQTQLYRNQLSVLFCYFKYAKHGKSGKKKTLEEEEDKSYQVQPQLKKLEDSKLSERGEQLDVPIHICLRIINTYPWINTAKCKMCHTIIALIVKHNHCSNPN